MALCGVVFVLPFASLPFSIGFKPTFLDLALGALFVWFLKLVIGRQRDLSPRRWAFRWRSLCCWRVFSFALGLVHSPANTCSCCAAFWEILLGISLFFVTVNTVRSVAEINWVTRWVMLGGAACAAIAVLFYILPQS